MNRIGKAHDTLRAPFSRRIALAGAVALMAGVVTLCVPGTAQADVNWPKCTNSDAVPAYQLQNIATRTSRNYYGRALQIVTGYHNNRLFVYARLIRANGETNPSIPYRKDHFLLLGGTPNSDGDIGGQGFCGTYVYGDDGKLNALIYAYPYYHTLNWEYQACGGVAYPPPGGISDWCTDVWW